MPADDVAGAPLATLQDDDTSALVVRAREGDDAAWARLVERYSGLLWSIARAHGLGDADASDVVQTSWLRLVERIDALDDPSATGCWLATTARNECRALVRRRATLVRNRSAWCANSREPGRRRNSARRKLSGAVFSSSRRDR